jgi:hypothetical protein
VTDCECGHPPEDHEDHDAQGIAFRVPCRGLVGWLGTPVAHCGCRGGA